jgi:serine/threonine protein phosphatase PrpC
MLRCPACGHDGFADAEFCESCGADLRSLRDAPRGHIELVTPSAAGLSDLGLRHARNEDALFLRTIEAGTVAVVCDGVSSSVAPQVAAQVAADAAGSYVLARLASHWDGCSPHEALSGALAAAADEVVRLPWLRGSGRNDAPSCTIVAAAWDGSAVNVAWTGDSRAYWLGDGQAQQLTSDHSWAQVQMDAGLASAAQALSDPRGHSITRWLGPDAPDDPVPVVSFTPPGGGLLVLCSDGLWNYVTSAGDLAERCEHTDDRSPLGRARALVVHALRSGGHDNVTVVVIGIDPIGTTSPQDEDQR